jgi:exodeoxyribonuclease-1
MKESLLWYDLETSGTDPGFDRVLQFAAVRTDLDLNPIEPPLNFYCYPGEDVVPDPDAMKVTGLKMSQIREEGLSEAEFSRRIHEAFSRPQTCVLGFNSIRFDDEFIRVLFYRNFFDPYAREWQNGNSRWDVIDLFRMAAALRPDGFNWPRHDHGGPSFRLEHLTAANGVSHEGAHDAVADVMATIGVAQRLRVAQPKLYDYLFSLRLKKSVLAQLYPIGKQAVVHVSSMYPATQHCLAIVLPIAVHPTNPNGIICFDLSKDPGPLIQLGPEELRRRLFSRSEDLGENEPRIPLKTIHVNKSPAISPLSTVAGLEGSLDLDLALCEQHKLQLQQTPGIVEKIDEAFSANQFARLDDPDLMLYQGDFFSREDREVMTAVQSAEPQGLSAYRGHFQDPRLPEMLFRYQARNYPNSLNADDQIRWHQFLKHRLASPLAESRRAKLQQALTASPDNAILRDLAEFFQSSESFPIG